VDLQLKQGTLDRLKTDRATLAAVPTTPEMVTEAEEIVASAVEQATAECSRGKPGPL